ncbi:hypothetical protein BsIDN1_46230 [Bacillus safensis]|uniref:Uncharacterized protein n=1 Tax=Bacillus safensis TaxID=561879 RepID=A0A5S9MDP2_BACIA|nr:hypothetical protein BsIDN1_46230 [Bacillus safensis]
MQLKTYPSKLSLKKKTKKTLCIGKIVLNFFLRERGILVSGFNKADYANVGTNFYFSRKKNILRFETKIRWRK